MRFLKLKYKIAQLSKATCKGNILCSSELKVKSKFWNHLKISLINFVITPSIPVTSIQWPWGDGWHCMLHCSSINAEIRPVPLISVLSMSCQTIVSVLTACLGGGDLVISEPYLTLLLPDTRFAHCFDPQLQGYAVVLCAFYFVLQLITQQAPCKRGPERFFTLRM